MATGTIPMHGAKLLWTNSSPTSDFAAHSSISGTNGFAQYHIVCKVSKNATSMVDFDLLLNIGDYHTITIITSPMSGLPQISFRPISKGSDGTLSIDNCDTRDVTATSRSQNNANIIPVYIYGIA